MQTESSSERRSLVTNISREELAAVAKACEAVVLETSDADYDGED